MKAVVFDMDGVIFDSERLVMECWIKIFDKYGYTGAQELCYRCTGLDAVNTGKVFRGVLGEDFPFERLREERSAMFHAIVNESGLPVKTGVNEILSWLSENGYKIALASSTRRDAVVQELTDACLINYFDEIVTGDMVSRGKPDPEIYLTACMRLDIDPHESYAIEDSYNGMRSAHAAGLRAIMVPDLIDADAEMRAIAAAVQPDLIGALQYIKQFAVINR